MHYVLKLTLPLAGELQVKMGRGAKVLSVAAVLSFPTQRWMPQLWVLNDNDAPMQKRTVRVVATGKPCDGVENMDFAGTFLLDNGGYVGHVFVEKP